MLKKKKTVILLMIFLIIVLVLLLTFFCLPTLRGKSVKTDNTIKPAYDYDLENNFLSIFSNIDYSNTDEDIVTTAYTIKKEKEDKYIIEAHLPKINLDTCESINNEIVEQLGNKLVDIV